MESGDALRVSSARLSSSNIWRNSSREVFSRSSLDGEEDEEALKWAAVERLPTYMRITRGVLKEEGEIREVGVKDLGLLEKKKLLDRLVKIAEDDNEKFLLKLKLRKKVWFPKQYMCNEKPFFCCYCGSISSPVYANLAQRADTIPVQQIHDIENHHFVQ